MTTRNPPTEERGKSAPKPGPRTKNITEEIRANAGPNPTTYGGDPPEPKISKIPLKDIRLDGFQNRDRRSEVVRSIATNFEEASLGVPVVRRGDDGLFHALEGRKMIAAIMERQKAIPGFMTHVWCEVVSERDSEARKRAKILVERSRPKKDQPLEEFRKEYEAKDKVAVDIVRRLSAKGVGIKGTGTPCEVEVECLSAIRYAHEQGVLEGTIDAVMGAWGLNKKGFHLKVLMPLAVLIHENPHIKIEELSAILSGTTPEELDAKAGSTDGRMRTKNIAKFIVDLYNGRTPDAQDPHRV